MDTHSHADSRGIHRHLGRPPIFAWMSLRNTKTRLVLGDVPEEFTSLPSSYINLCDAADHPWTLPIFIEAQRRLTAQLGTGAQPTRGDSREAYVFTMATHRYALTREMAAAGWVQWSITVQTRTREECEEEGVKYRNFRYAVHAWVSPADEVALVKLKTQGKFIPGHR